MTLKIILFHGLGKSASILFLGVDGEYLDKLLLHMFVKMMVAYVDVLGPRAKIGKSCQFKVA